MRVRRIFKAFLVFLIALIGLLLLTFILINLPFSHRFVTQKVNGIFKSSGLPVHIESIKKVFPWSVYAEDILINGQQGDTIVFAERVSADLSPLALIRKKVILHSVSLADARIQFLRYSGEEQLNIAEAFSQGKKAEPVSLDDTKRPWEVSVADAEVTGFSFLMIDSVAGIYVSQDVDRIKIETKKMSLAERTKAQQGL
jgi:translocation and assembly module TamB